MGLIHALADVLAPGERLRFEIERTADGLVLLVQPYLATAAQDPDAATDAARLRAALAMPLRVQGGIAELDAGFPELLATYASQRQDVGRTLGVLEALKEAGKAGARLAGDKEKDGGPTRAGEALAAPEAPAPVAAPQLDGSGTGTGSLF